MPQFDADVAITEYLGSHAPISAVVKAQVSDFVVNEVCRDGTVVRLTSTSLPKVSSDASPESSAPERTPPTTDAEWEAACDALDKQLASTCASDLSVASSIRQFAQTPPEAQRASGDAAPSTPSASLVLPPLADKAARKAVHAWVKCNVPELITDTVEGDAGAGCIRIRRFDACRPWKRRRVGDSRDASDGVNEDATLDNTYDPREDHTRPGRGRARGRGRSGRGGSRERTMRYDPNHVDRRTYVQFVLWKEGKDTVFALSEIAKRLRLDVNELSHAGTKDKRGITTQRVRVRGVALPRLLSLNHTFRKHGTQKIAVGNVEVLPRDQSDRLGLGDLGGNRFTVALRELDLRASNARENIEAAVASVRDNGFINYFGLQRFGSGAFRTHEIGYSVLRGDFKEVCQRLLTPVIIDGVAEGLAELREDRKRCDDALRRFASGCSKAAELLNGLPKWMNIERSVVESYARDEKRGAPHDHKAAFGQVPRTLRKMYGHAVQSYLWNLMASARIQMSRGSLALPGDLILSHRTLGRDCPLSSETPVRTVGQNEEIPVREVVIPMVGSKVPVPDTPTGHVARDVLTREKIDVCSVPTDYDMVGTYRWLIARPKDVSLDVREYHDRYGRILPSDVGHLVKDEHTRVSNGQSTSGSRTGARAEEGKKMDDGVFPGRSQSSSRTLQAAVLSFTLGPAEYATMFIRELLKQDSSVANQKAQQKNALDREDRLDALDAAGVKHQNSLSMSSQLMNSQKDDGAVHQEDTTVQ